MKIILTLALSALMLCGCIAEWKNPKGPQRWPAGPNIQPMADNTGAPVANSGPPPSQP
jgi:hypothetical protein